MGRREWSGWEWLEFWGDQVKYWRRLQKKFPTLIAMSSMGGIMVNRYLYAKLGQADGGLWMWRGSARFKAYVGGYEDPNSPGVRKAVWEGNPEDQPANTFDVSDVDMP